MPQAPTNNYFSYWLSCCYFNKQIHHSVHKRLKSTSCFLLSFPQNQIWFIFIACFIQWHSTVLGTEIKQMFNDQTHLNVCCGCLILKYWSSCVLLPLTSWWCSALGLCSTCYLSPLPLICWYPESEVAADLWEQIQGFPRRGRRRFQ